MGDNNNCYGSANKMLRKAMKEYGISGSAAQDAFGWDRSRAARRPAWAIQALAQQSSRLDVVWRRRRRRPR